MFVFFQVVLRYGKKLKDKSKNKYFFIPIPSLRFSFVRKIIKFSLKHSRHHLPEEIRDVFTLQDIDTIINTLRELEPFELINVNINNSDTRVKIRIYTR